MTTRRVHDDDITIGRREFIYKGVAGFTGLLFSDLLFDASVFAESWIKETSVSLHDPVWIRNSIKTLWEDRRRCGVTPLLRFVPPFNSGLCLYLKNEALSPTGSLKHRVAWGLVMQAD